MRRFPMLFRTSNCTAKKGPVRISEQCSELFVYQPGILNSAYTIQLTNTAMLLLISQVERTHQIYLDLPFPAKFQKLRLLSEFTTNFVSLSIHLTMYDTIPMVDPRLARIGFFENSHVEKTNQRREVVPRRVSDVRSVNINVCSN